MVKGFVVELLAKAYWSFGREAQWNRKLILIKELGRGTVAWANGQWKLEKTFDQRKNFGSDGAYGRCFRGKPFPMKKSWQQGHNYQIKCGSEKRDVAQSSPATATSLSTKPDGMTTSKIRTAINLLDSRASPQVRFSGKRRFQVAKHHSKRAGILRRLLPHINAGNYTEYEDYIVFGTEDVFDMIDGIAARPSERNDHSLADAAHKLVSDSKLHDGRRHAAARVTLDKTPSFATDAIEILSPEQRAVFFEMLSKVLEEKRGGGEHPRGFSKTDVEDALDAAFAEEVLGKLPKIIHRVLTLEELDLDSILDEDVKRYFAEAHRCYLYGFNIACAVLCRAILASALESICDPKRTILRRVAPGKSYFEALVRKASDDGRLLDDRPEWAIMIRDAGNEAIHNFPLFKQHWSDKVHDILLNARKVLLDLYAKAP